MAGSKYPISERVLEIHEESQKLGFLLDWLMGQYTLCKPHRHSEECELDRGTGVRICGYKQGEFAPQFVSIEKLLADYFGIDLKGYEKEKQEMLQDLQRANGS